MFGDIGAGLGSFGGGLANLFGAAGKGGEAELKQRIALWNAIQDPSFDMSTLTPPQLQILAEEAPQLYQAVVPDEVKLANDSPELQAAQQRGLSQMQEIASQGMPLADRLSAQTIQDAAAKSSRGAQESILRNMAQRGRLGAGDELQARMVGNQQTGSLTGQMARDALAQSLDRRMGAIGQASNMAGSMRQQGFQNSMANANVVNNFNNMVAQMRSNQNLQNTQMANQAQAYNAAQKQRVGEANVQARYNTQLENVNRQNQLKQQGFQNKVTKTAGATGALGDLARAKYDEQAARAQNIQAVGQGAGQAAGGAADVFAGSGYMGTSLADLYKKPNYGTNFNFYGNNGP